MPSLMSGKKSSQPLTNAMRNLATGRHHDATESKEKKKEKNRKKMKMKMMKMNMKKQEEQNVLFHYPQTRFDEANFLFFAAVYVHVA